MKLETVIGAACLLALACLCFSFNDIAEKNHAVELINSSEIDLRSYTVEIAVIKLRKFNTQTQKLNFAVTDEAGKKVISQMVDTDANGISDLLLFQTDISAKDSRKFYIQLDTNGEKINYTTSTYCRFVPERLDDFAWENDKVAFRSYGPKEQQLWESGDKKAGLISSGIDCWLKRVPYPIINKWYEKDRNGGSYHKDDGEGLDNFQVGVSRGCGGTALFMNNKFYPSQNYSSWKIITNGPIRSIFELTYKPIQLDGDTITETKRITIDLGSNLYKCDVSFKSTQVVSKIAVGISLHENKGTINTHKNKGWISYWEPIEDSEIGMAIILSKDNFVNFIKKENQPLDENNVWVISKVNNNKATYYSGFGWKKSNQFKNDIEWVEYLDHFSDQSNAAVTLNIK